MSSTSGGGPVRPGGPGPSPGIGPGSPLGEAETGGRRRNLAGFLADPAPLGLSGFALTTFALGFILVEGNPMGGLPVVFALAAAYGGLAQLLAGMWGFAEGNTFAALAFSSYGAFWISFVFLNYFFLDKIPAADVASTMSLYLGGWGFFTFYLWIASFRVSVAINVVLLLLWIAYAVLAIAYAVGDRPEETVVQLGGGLACLCAAAAWYTAFAGVTNKTFGKTVIPVGDLSVH